MIVNEKDMLVAENAAKMKRIKADADSYEIQKKAEAIKSAGDLYISAELAKAANTTAEKWDGKAPQVLGGSGIMNMLQLKDQGPEKK
jgi:hypothetical protein